ncbi:MAG: hypothetical protein C0469_07685 [Cyanobacteria bacterium DS2.3.42]|nr:hypothetical protein [Cyanobacteria bacterium DS2.3.42]
MVAPSNSKPSSFTRLLTQLDLWFEGNGKKAWRIAPAVTPTNDRKFFLVDPGFDCNLTTSRDSSGAKLGLGITVPKGAILVGDGTTELSLLTNGGAADNGKTFVLDSTVPLGVKLATAGGGSGDVVGPASAADHAVALFNGTTGKIIKDGGVGTAGQVFTSNGPGVAPTFQAAGAVDPDLAAIAALTGTGIACRTAADTWVLRSLAVADAKLTLSNPGGVAGNPTIGFGSVASGDLSDTANIALRNNANSWSAAQTPNAAGTIDLGTTALPFRNLIFGGAATNNTKLVSATTTAQRTCTFPDANSNPVIPDTGAANNFLTAISAGGVISKAQPAFSNLSGVGTIAQGCTNNGSLGVSALGMYAGDGSKVIQVTGTALQSFRVNAGGTAIEAYTPVGAGVDSYIKTKTATETRTNTTTLTDDADLSFPVGAGETWNFTALLALNSGSATPDFKFLFDGPTGSTIGFQTTSSNDGFQGGGVGSVAGAGGTPIVQNQTASTHQLVQVSGQIVTTTNSGNCKLRWAQNTSNGTSQNLLGASILIAVKG